MPEMAVAGQLLAAGVPSAARTATDIATGLSLNHVAGAQGARAVPNLPKNAPALKRGEFGAAYLNSGAYQEQITAAAKAIYQARAAGKNIDDNEPKDEVTLYPPQPPAGPGTQGPTDTDPGLG